MFLKKLFFFILIFYLSGCTTYEPGQYLNDYRKELSSARISQDFDIFLDGELLNNQTNITHGKKIKIYSHASNSNTDGDNESQPAITAGITTLTIVTFGIAALVWLPIFPWAWSSQPIELTTFHKKTYVQSSTSSTWIGTAYKDTKARDTAKVNALKKLLNQLDHDIYSEQDFTQSISERISQSKIEKIAKKMLASLKLQNNKKYTILISSDHENELIDRCNIALRKELRNKENIQILNYKDDMIHEVRELRNSEEIKQADFYGKKKLLSPEYSLKTTVFVDKKYGAFFDATLSNLSTGVIIWENIERIY